MLCAQYPKPEPTRVTLIEPLSGLFVRVRSLAVGNKASYVNAVDTVPTRRAHAAVTTADNSRCIQAESFNRSEESEVHEDTSDTLPPRRLVLVSSSEPKPPPTSVKLVDPDAAPFTRTTVLTEIARSYVTDADSVAKPAPQAPLTTADIDEDVPELIFTRSAVDDTQVVAWPCVPPTRTRRRVEYSRTPYAVPTIVKLTDPVFAPFTRVTLLKVIGRKSKLNCDDNV